MHSPLTRRKSFLQALGAAAAAPSLSAQAPPARRAVFQVGPGAGRPGKLTAARPGQVQLKVSGEDTGGEFALFEVPPGNGGPPLHVHHVENELFWVLEGELDVQIGTEVLRLTAGACAYAPKMIPHTWQPVAGREVRFLSLAEPAGRLEEFIAELLRMRRSGVVDAAAMKSLFEKYDMEVVGPPLVARPA